MNEYTGLVKDMLKDIEMREEISDALLKQIDKNPVFKTELTNRIIEKVKKEGNDNFLYELLEQGIFDRPELLEMANTAQIPLDLLKE